MAVRLIDLQLLYGVAGAREQFENLCAQLIRSQSPTATGIRVHRGDGGIDVYEGKFTGEEGIHVFQVKYFPNGIGKSQRNEVKESFTRCRTNTQFTTKKWTLCLPVDLSIEETEWFSRWVQEQARYEIDIDWSGATQLEGLLYHADNRGIKEAFFKEEYLTQIREMHGILQELGGNPPNSFEQLHKETKALCKIYREERLSKIIVGETFAKLDPEAPKIVLHIVPFGAFEPGVRFNIDLLMNADKRGLREPLRLASGDFPLSQYNFDGLLTAEQDTYVQVSRNGSIEAVDTSILNAAREKRFTRGSMYETNLLRAIRRYLDALEGLDVEPPLFVMVSFLGVKGYRILFNPNVFEDIYDHRIDRSNLIMLEVVIDSYDCNLAEVMKPIFDTIANAAKWPRSMMYDESGKSLHTNL